MNTSTTRGRVLASLLASAAAAALLAGCASDVDAPASAAPAGADAQVLADYGLDGRGAREIIDELDALPLDQRSGDYIASVRPDHLLVTDVEGREALLDMPADDFYVSVAPYVDVTHECYFHSLTTCTGELQGVDVQLRVVDTATGDVVVDEVRSTFANGFVGLWLPRGGEYEVEVSYDGMTAATTLSTDAEDDATCVTTMQLA